MGDPSSKAYTTRLPATEAEQLEAALEETDQSRSELVRRAIRYYLSKNPDEITVLYPENSVSHLMAELGGNNA
jgi:metal-responsive CopG/Arc/MetJ family transcriptional regulator